MVQSLKRDKKNLILKRWFFSNLCRFKNHGFSTIQGRWNTRAKAVKLFFMIFSCNRNPILYDIIRNKAGTGDIQQRRVSSVLNWSNSFRDVFFHSISKSSSRAESVQTQGSKHRIKGTGTQECRNAKRLKQGILRWKSVAVVHAVTFYSLFL